MLPFGTALQRCADKAGEDRVRIVRARAELGMELHRNVERMARQLDDLGQMPLGVPARKPEARRLQRRHKIVADLIAVAMALANHVPAVERRRKGMGIVESAYSAAQVRLRPILMTVLTMIFGMLPLMFSTGAGANGNSSLGTGVVGGMSIGTLALLFVVPVFYIVFEYLQEKVRKPMEVEADEQFKQEQERSLAEKNQSKS